MIKFLFKGILRDKSRSLLPVIVVAIGVALTIFFSGFLEGVMGDMIGQNARYETGHVKIMTRVYEKNKDQLPLDLALLNVDSLVQLLEKEHPDMDWVKRIRFGGLVDVPDEEGETKGQRPATGLALELFSEQSNEAERLKLESSLVKGQIPNNPGEAIVSNEFAEKLDVEIGDKVTYFGSTMYGSMALQNFTVSGTIHFGVAAMDRGALIVDISDAQQMLDMPDGAGEILGFLPTGVYDNEMATELMGEFNSQFTGDDEFAPTMVRLRDQNNLASMLDYVDIAAGLFVGIFILAMSIVLWNTGLIAGLRRYKEFGVRLALGEAKGDIYRSMIMEAVLIGAIGSVLGTALGLGITYYMQIVGLDISQYMDNAGVMMPSTMRAKVTLSLFYIGFIPGLLAMVLGNMMAGVGIYKRETATLFKELEV